MDYFNSKQQNALNSYVNANIYIGLYVEKEIQTSKNNNNNNRKNIYQILRQCIEIMIIWEKRIFRKNLLFFSLNINKKKGIG